MSIFLIFLIRNFAITVFISEDYSILSAITVYLYDDYSIPLIVESCCSDRLWICKRMPLPITNISIHPSAIINLYVWYLWLYNLWLIYCFSTVTFLWLINSDYRIPMIIDFYSNTVYWLIYCSYSNPMMIDFYYYSITFTIIGSLLLFRVITCQTTSFTGDYEINISLPRPIGDDHDSSLHSYYHKHIS